MIILQSLALDLPPYETFISGQMATDFWQILKWILFLIASVAMIGFAITILGHFVRMIRQVIFTADTDNDDRRRYRNDDDDYGW